MSIWNPVPLVPKGEHPLQTCNEMRARLEVYSRHDNVTHRALATAAIQGLSGEDKYTSLAYYSLVALEAARDNLMRHVELSLAPPLMFVESDEQTRKDAARYRYMRTTFETVGNRSLLQWHLPRAYDDKSFPQQLDESIDAGIARKS